MKINFPKQKMRSTMKKDKWRKKHLDWVEDIIFSKDSPVRSSLRKKKKNYNLYLGKTTKADYNLILNPAGLNDIFIPDEIEHYPIAKPYLNVLIGEEADRRFEWKVVVTNPNAISEIEEQKNNLLKQKISQLVQDSELPEEEIQKQFKNYLYYLKFEYQDVREKRANLILKHYIKELDLKLKFNAGMKDALIVGEEGYVASIVNGNPQIDLLDPKKTFILRGGYSNRYEDADIIISYDYVSPGTLMDTYYTYLKDKDVKWLDTEPNKSGTSGEDTTMDTDELGVNIARQELMEDYLQMPGEAYGSDFANAYSDVTDNYGNVRLIKIFWKSFKMIQKVKYFDELGDVQYKFESEFYIPLEDEGEESQKYWITEWWEGHKIGKDIYPVIKPRDIQYNKFSDPGYNHPGIVGQIYNTGNMEVVSYMDTAAPYQFLYDATMHKLQDALSKFFGSLIPVDYARLPEGWDVTKWVYFARKSGIDVRDSFKEGNKGAARGKIAANIGNTSPTINQQLGDFIQQQINMLNYVEMQMGRIIGVPPQRLGSIENRETVGGVERAVTQSSFITNEIFKIHDNIKKRVLTLLLETAKIALKDNPQKFQSIGDDYLAQLFEADDTFTEEEYGLIVDNENDLTKLEQSFEQLAHAAMQNQALKFSDLMKIFTTSSLSEKQRLIEQGEEEMIQRQEAQQEREARIAEAQLEQVRLQAEKAEQLDLRKHQENLLMDKYTVDQNNQTQRMKIGKDMADTVNDVSPGDKLELEYRKLEDDLMTKMRDLDEQIRSNKAGEKLEAKKIAKAATKTV